MDAAAWIRSRLVGFTCAACGTPFRRERIRVLAQREELFFVALDCGACISESVAIISVGAAASDAAYEPHVTGLDDLPQDAPLAARRDAAMGAGDVLVMHEFLRGFDGDFHSLFGASRKRPTGSAGA